MSSAICFWCITRTYVLRIIEAKEVKLVYVQMRTTRATQKQIGQLAFYFVGKPNPNKTHRRANIKSSAKLIERGASMFSHNPRILYMYFHPHPTVPFDTTAATFLG